MAATVSRVRHWVSGGMIGWYPKLVQIKNDYSCDKGDHECIEAMYRDKGGMMLYRPPLGHEHRSIEWSMYC